MNWKKEKKLLSGFLLQKDVYTTNLLYEHNKFPIINNKFYIPFRKIEKEETNIDLEPYITIFNNRKKIKSLTPSRKTKLKFPLPKIEIPFSSNIDFYSNLKGNVRLKYMDDDSNITSRKGKKIEYSFNDEKIFFDKQNNDLNLNSFEPNNLNHKKKKESIFYNSYFPLKKNIEIINENLKQRKKKKKIIIKDPMFKTQIQS